MEQVIEMLKNRIKELNAECEIPYMSENFYIEMSARKEEVELILSELEMILFEKL